MSKYYDENITGETTDFILIFVLYSIITDEIKRTSRFQQPQNIAGKKDLIITMSIKLDVSNGNREWRIQDSPVV